MVFRGFAVGVGNRLHDIELEGILHRQAGLARVRPVRVHIPVVVAPDEGHGFARPVDNMAMFAAVERFLAQYLKGRYQQSMTPEVAERLKAITVDVKTVQKPKRTGPVGISKVALDLQEGSLSCRARMEAGRQSVQLLQSVGVKSDGNAWIVTETSAIPGNTATNRTVLEKGSLVVRKRSVWQEPVADGGEERSSLPSLRTTALLRRMVHLQAYVGATGPAVTVQPTVSPTS